MNYALTRSILAPLLVIVLLGSGNARADCRSKIRDHQYKLEESSETLLAIGAGTLGSSIAFIGALPIAIGLEITGLGVIGVGGIKSLGQRKLKRYSSLLTAIYKDYGNWVSAEDMEIYDRHFEEIRQKFVAQVQKTNPNLTENDIIDRVKRADANEDFCDGRLHRIKNFARWIGKQP